VAFFRPPPRVMDVERLIPPGPDTLIVTRNMTILWESMGENAAICDTRFLSLLEALAMELGPIRRNITDNFSLEDISPELLFYLLGYESALAVYPPDDDPGFLFVSRVQPTVVFLEQFVIFIDEEAHIERVPFRELTIREVSTEEDHEPTFFYTFDDDILIFSSDRQRFDAALDLLLGDVSTSVADEPIRRELERFRSEDASAWGFSRGDLVKNDMTDSILFRFPGVDASTGPFPMFFFMTREGKSLLTTAAWNMGGTFPRSPSPPPRLRYADQPLLSFFVSRDLLTVGDRTTELLSRLFPAGCRAALFSGDSPEATHPVIWGTAGPDADSILRNALENSSPPTSRRLVDDVLITDGVSNGNSMAYTVGDGLLIIGRNAEDILAHRRFIQNNVSDPYPPSGVIIAVHLRPTALIEASNFEDVFLPLLSGYGFLGAGADKRKNEAVSYRELAVGLSAWETAEILAWTGDDQTNLTIILSRKEDQP